METAIIGYIIIGLLLVGLILSFSLLKALSSTIEEIKYSTIALLNSNNEIKDEFKSQANPYSNEFDTIE
jgi:hypothetical protein